jgi:Fusaric acid resistance protein family
VLKDLRIGINMVDLQRDRDAMPLPVRAAVDDILTGTAHLFAVEAALGRVQPALPSLLSDIDRALDAVIAIPGDRTRDLLLQLVGIRRGLFADAPPYRPALPPDDGPPDDAPLDGGTLPQPSPLAAA